MSCNCLNLRQRAACVVDRASPQPATVEASQCVVERGLPKGRFKVQHLRGRKVLQEFDVPNGIVDVGLNHILESEFHAGAQATTWYIGLVDNAGFSAFTAADIMSSHAGWAESSAYVAATRPQWTCGAAAARQITNAVTVDFAMNGTLTVKGLFITTNNVKGGATGILWSSAAFVSGVLVNASDTLKVTYTVSG